MEDSLFNKIVDKSALKHSVYQQTYSAFKLFKQSIRSTWEEFNNYDEKHPEKKINSTCFKFKDRGEFEMELQFGGDVLVFIMHTNVFQFPRLDTVFNSTYIKEDSSRSYVGVINIYNFLADSFKYRRVNDLGYLIGRVFINKDGHYFIQGTKELNRLHNSFDTAKIDMKIVKDIVSQSILYTLNFDLLMPPYKEVKIVNVNDFRVTADNLRLKTGKRLGFKFNENTFEEEGEE